MNQFKFCPVCGGKLEFRGGHEKVLTCLKCSFKFYQNSAPASGAIIINEKNQILLSEKNLKPYIGQWDIIGGFLKDGEHPEDGIRREVKEEIGVDIEIIKLFGVYMGQYYLGKNIYKNTLNFYYICRIKNGNPKIIEEISKLKWFYRKNIPYDKMAFDQEKQLIKDFFNIK